MPADGNLRVKQGFESRPGCETAHRGLWLIIRQLICYYVLPEL